MKRKDFYFVLKRNVGNPVWGWSVWWRFVDGYTVSLFDVKTREAGRAACERLNEALNGFYYGD